MMFSSNTFRFAICFLSLSLSATAETIRGAHRELAETAVNLGDAGKFVILAMSGISTVPASVITGDIAVSPIDSTAITGFGLSLHSTETYSTSDQVTGRAFASNDPKKKLSFLVTATGNMETAYTYAENRPNTDAARLDLGEGTLGGDKGGPNAPLTPGVYTFGTAVAIDNDIAFQGTATDVFIIQITGTLKLASKVQVTLAGGALAENIFWQVSDAVTVGTRAHMEGIILGKTSVHLETDSSLNGRILAQTACTLDKATVNEP
jgi:hypothetical protein